MAYIGPAPNPGQNREVDDISSGFNGSEVNFTLQVNSQNVSPGSSNNIIVSLGGVVQNPSTDYTVAASTLTFTTAPANGLSFFGLVLGQQVDIQSVADSASIVTPTLSAPTVTGDLSIADKIIHTGDTNNAIRFPAADTITAETGGSERVRVDSSGNVGIGTASPGAKIHAASGSDSVVGARIVGGASGGTDIADFRTNNGTIRMKINNDVTVSTGNLVIGTSGKGIDFSATSDGSGTSNVSELLTDFETGTFSLGGPVIGGGSFTATVGRYTRIGNICHVFVVADSFSTSGQNHDLQLSGLPFASSSSNASHAVVSTNAPSFSNGLKANIPSSNTIMAIRSQWADDGIKSQVFNGYGIAFNATYIVG